MGSPLRVLFLCGPAQQNGVILATLRKEFADASWVPIDSRDALSRGLEPNSFDLVLVQYPLQWDEAQAAIGLIKDRCPDRPIVMFTLSDDDERTLAAADPAFPAAAGRVLDLLFRAVRAAFDKADLLLQHRLAEEAARESEARFRSVFESATDAIVLSDPEGKIVGWNDRASAMFGYTAEETIGQPLTVLMPVRYRGQHERGIERARSYSHHSMVGRTLELHGVRKNGVEFPIELSIGSWNSARGSFYSGMIRDITERKRSEDRLRDSYERLRALSARVQSVREEERAVIAREIHDLLGQALTAIRFDIAWLRSRIMSGNASKDALAERLDGMVDRVEDTIDQVRRISGELRPVVLDELGLVAALEGHAREFASRTGIRSRVQSDLSEESLDPGEAIALFRIVQESLTNVARHAGARGVEIRLHGGNGDPLEVEVQDDGRGITEAEAGGASLGILGMRERAHSVGGILAITSGAGRGTTVSVQVPARAPVAIAPSVDAPATVGSSR